MSTARKSMKVRVAGISIVLLASMILGAIPMASAYSPPWIELAPLSEGRTAAVTVMDSANGTIYVIGGALNISGIDFDNVTTMVTAYGVNNGTSWAVSSMPTAVRSACGALGENGKIYVFSGFDAGYVATTQIYDIATNSWSTGANIPFSTALAKCVVVWPKMYVIGGTLTTTDVQIYNALTNSWSAGVALPFGKYAGAATYVQSINSIFYIGGGFPANSSVLQFKIGSGTWTTVASLPSPVTALDATTGLDGLIYAVGGSSSPMAGVVPVYSSGYYYCTNNDTWFPLPGMTYARKYLGVVSYQEKILAVGGNDGSGALANVEMLRTLEATTSFSPGIIGQGGSGWLNISVDSFAAEKGMAVAYYMKSTGGIVYPAVSNIFAPGQASSLIEIPQTLPVGGYEIHVFFGVTFETGTYTFPELVFPILVTATVSIEQQIQNLMDQIIMLEAQIAGMNASLSSGLNETMDNITKLQQQLADVSSNLTSFVAALQLQIDQLNTTLTNEINDLQTALAAAQADLDAKIAEMNASISLAMTDMHNEILFLQTKNDQLQSQINDLQSSLEELELTMNQNDQNILDKVNKTSDDVGKTNTSLSASLGSLGATAMVEILGVFVALLVAILVMYTSMNRTIRALKEQKAGKEPEEGADVPEIKADEPAPPVEQMSRVRTVKKAPEEQKLPPAPPEEKL